MTGILSALAPQPPFPLSPCCSWTILEAAWCFLCLQHCTFLSVPPTANKVVPKRICAGIIFLHGSLQADCNGSHSALCRLHLPPPPQCSAFSPFFTLNASGVPGYSVQLWWVWLQDQRPNSTSENSGSQPLPYWILFIIFNPLTSCPKREGLSLFSSSSFFSLIFFFIKRVWIWISTFSPACISNQRSLDFYIGLCGFVLDKCTISIYLFKAMKNSSSIALESWDLGWNRSGPAWERGSA